MVLSKLTPESMNIMVISSTLNEDIVYDKVEPWFSTNYTDREIPNEWLEGWKNVKKYCNFSLPESNKFLTTNFNLINAEKEIPQFPEKIMDSDLVELWYKADKKFKQPIAYMNYYLLSPIAQESAIR